MKMKNWHHKSVEKLPEFQALYEGHYPQALKSAIKFTKNLDMAEDAVQESFIKAYVNWDHIQDYEHFVRWLALSTKHSCIDNVRKNSRYVLMEDLKPMGYHLKTDQHLPVEALIQWENRRELRKMVFSLPTPYRYILVKKYYRKRSYQEISRQTGITENTLRSRCYRALRQLQDRYSEQIKEIIIKDPCDIMGGAPPPGVRFPERRS